MLTSIDVQFIFDRVRLGLSSSTNILQIADAALRVVFLLFSPSSYSWNMWNVRHFFKFTTKTTQPRPQVFSVDGALTCENAAFLTSFPR